jgi:hypothetical protein
MNALETAIFDTLKAAPAVAALLSNGEDDIHADEAPENSAFPHIVFMQIAGTPRYSLPKREWEEFVYLVKGVTQEKGSKKAQEIAEAVDEVLSDGTFTVPGHTLMYSRKLIDMPPLTETDQGKRYNHRGGHFEIWVGPEP